MADKAVAGAPDQSMMIYALTPQLGFTPSQMKSFYYKIGTILQATETRHVEYKLGNFVINNLNEHVRRYGSAFLNSGGGTLLLGIADNGVVVGVQLSLYAKERIRNIISNEFALFKPPVSAAYYEINFVPTCINYMYVVEIHVKPGKPDEIYTCKFDKMFIRRDGSVQGPLWPREIREIVLEKYKKVISHETLTTSEESPLVSLPDATPVISSSKSFASLHVTTG